MLHSKSQRIETALNYHNRSQVEYEKRNQKKKPSDVVWLDVNNIGILKLNLIAFHNCLIINRFRSKKALSEIIFFSI